jgi:CRISPR-associated protein Cas1
MLRDDRDFDFEHRNRRPPRDPVNCLLSYLYALLVKDLTAVCCGVGFDPYLGFFHKPRFGRPALALDLAEEFRPLVADSVVVNLINNGEVQPSNFIVRAGGVALTPEGRKIVIAAYERRLDVEATHPLFDYRVSYRRLFEVQARLLGAYLLREVPEYVPFTTR